MLDVRVVDTDAQSYVQHTVSAVLAAAEREKIKCIFSPLRLAYNGPILGGHGIGKTPCHLPFGMLHISVCVAHV